MFYVLDNNEKVVGLIQHDIDKNCKNIYFDDSLQEDLSTGAEALTFSSILEKKLMKFVSVGNYIAFKKGDTFKLMQIVETEEEKSQDGIIKSIYCESAGLELINEVYTGGDMESVNFEMFLSNILQNTFWNVGNIDSNLVKHIPLKMDKKSISSLIQEHSKAFGAEISFRVEIKNNKVIGRYIDAYVKRGKDVGKRLEINKEIKNIIRKINMMDYATKLIGKGRDGLSFKDIEDSNLNKPKGQDFIVNEDAFSQLNYKGRHITKIFEFDTLDPRELLLQSKKALYEYSKVKIEYQIDSNVIDYSDIEIGDTIYVSDVAFEPPILVSARVSSLEISKSNPSNNRVVLSNFKDIKSKVANSTIDTTPIFNAIDNIDKKVTNVNDKVNSIDKNLELVATLVEVVKDLKKENNELKVILESLEIKNT